MLTILTTTENLEQTQSAIKSIDRLSELVTVITDPGKCNDLNTLVVKNGHIIFTFDWYDSEPPYVIPPIILSENNLLALAFAKLGNHQRAFEFVNEDSPLFQHLFIITRLLFGYEITEEMMSFIKATSAHNLAMVSYYGNFPNGKDQNNLKNAFETALRSAENDEQRIFTLKHYLNLLLDLDEKEQAKALISKYKKIAISDEAQLALNLHLATILKEELTLPYVERELDQILSIQLAGIEKFEEAELKSQAGLLLMEAAEIANFKKDFTTSKELINKSIQYFKQEEMEDFLGEAGLKKAVLLYTWSKNGHPQYYKAAINAFQDVLKIFKRDSHPKEFADVHHKLALIYSEIPVSTEEKPMWTAFCASSFKEVLNFYTLEQYPYEYAMACHNYATALMDFPPAKIHDNLQKASEFFESALKVRTPDKYPFERALTLLNLLELGWLTHNESGDDEFSKYKLMKSQAEEVKKLISDPALLKRADEQLKKLEKLRTLI